MTDKKIKPTNPDQTEKADTEGKQAADRKTSALRPNRRVSGRKTSGARPSH